MGPEGSIEIVYVQIEGFACRIKCNQNIVIYFC